MAIIVIHHYTTRGTYVIHQHIYIVNISLSDGLVISCKDTQLTNVEGRHVSRSSVEESQAAVIYFHLLFMRYFPNKSFSHIT